MSHSAVRDLANDASLLDIARQSLGPTAIPFRATLFDKSPATNWLIPWHQDTALPLTARFEAEGWGPWSMKANVNYAHAPAWALARVIALRLHLDDSTEDNGPLRVIPDSHRSGVLTDAEIGVVVHSRDAVDCLVPRGGVVTMRPLLIHSSSKAIVDAARRVLHIEYSDALELAPGIRLAIA
jgi:ectoine hydroxylase-related dioxygenase (phytanoyl-CoA dioxygenase family)